MQSNKTVNDSAGDEIRSFYENSMDAILITTPQGKFISVNPAACSIFGTTTEKLIQMGRDGIVDQTDPRLASFLEQRKLTGKARGEIIHIRQNGEKFPAEISSAVFLMPSGEERTILIIRDITERKELEQKILAEQQLNHQKMLTGVAIEEQEKVRNEIGRELHDNINQILGTVKLFLGMIIQKKESGEDLLNMSHQYVDTAIQEIRKLSKGLVAPSLGTVSLENALNDLINTINIGKEFKVELDYRVDSSHSLKKDMELMIYRIVQEQINNIQKYSKSHTALISIRSIADGHISLAITDNGVGFDTSKKPQGIGLRNISSRVEYYSGTVKVISSPGKGCRLEVDIPLEKVA